MPGSVRIRNRRHLLGGLGGGSGTPNPDFGQQGGDTGAISAVGIAGSQYGLLANNRFTGKSQSGGGGGTPAPGKSTLAANNSVMTIGSGTGAVKTRVTITTKDSSGNAISVGGYASSLTPYTTGGGDSTCTLGAVVDNNDGTYYFDMTGTAVGVTDRSAFTIGVLLNGVDITGSAKPTSRVNDTPTVYPASDGTFGWGFSGADDTARSGSFTQGGAGRTMLTHQSWAGNPYDEWLADGASKVYGTDSIRRDFIATVGNSRSNLFTSEAAAGRNVLYMRFGLRLGPDFNDNGTVTVSRQQKLFRLQKAGFSGNPFISFFIGGGDAVPTANNAGKLTMLWDAWNSGAGDRVMPIGASSSFNLQNHLDEVVWYEFYVDWSDPHHCKARAWVNDLDQQQFDEDYSGYSGPNDAPSVATMGEILLADVVNKLNNTCSQWVGCVGISTKPMGIPT